jgi:hypothetical protein
MLIEFTTRLEEVIPTPLNTNNISYHTHNIISYHMRTLNKD